MSEIWRRKLGVGEEGRMRERERGERRKTREGVWKKGHMKGANDIDTLNSTW
jgi:hypothetical protein